jgi:hypothetical protein
MVKKSLKSFGGKLENEKTTEYIQEALNAIQDIVDIK